MKTHKLPFSFDDIYVTSKKAQSIAKEKNVIVEFDFNTITCLVNADTDLHSLYRDYFNAHTMEWKNIGPDCVLNYEPEIHLELERRKKAQEQKREQQRKEWEAQEKAEMEAFSQTVKGVELELADAEGWKKSREVNKDGYGGAALDYAECWAKLMQIEIAKGKTVSECYEYTQKGLGFLGITGFQFGCAVSTLSSTWKHGEELRKVHNKKYGVSEDKKGVVNPAVITINK